MSSPVACSQPPRRRATCRRLLACLAASALATLAIPSPSSAATERPGPPSSLPTSPRPIDLRATTSAARRSASNATAPTGNHSEAGRLRSAGIVPTTYTVDSTEDTNDGVCDAVAEDCTLREAILAANANPGADIIAFDIAGTGPHTIGILSDLPDITEAVTLDGTTEPDFDDIPMIVLDGIATIGPSGLGLSITSSGSTVRGLCIHRFFTHSAILVWNGASSNVVEGNFIGTDASGTTSIGTGSGIDLHSASSNTIGGTTAEARNVIAGTTLPAIVVRHGSNNNTIAGNYLGLDVTGTVHLPNAGNDFALFDSTGNTFGGIASGARNVAAGNTDAGLAQVGLSIDPFDPPNTSPTGNVIAGNYIGTDATGNVAFGTASVAVYMESASNNTIGGAGAAGNVIGGGALGNVRIVGGVLGASGNVVSGNSIGIGAGGTTPLPTAHNGVRVSHGASGNTLQDNVIANSTFHGVLVRSDAGSGNRITGNRISSNGLLGIDLSGDPVDDGDPNGDGPTPNDADDTDSGPNDFQNFPVITGIGDLGQVLGTLSSTPNTAFTIEVFQSPTCDPSGFGEAASFVGLGAANTNGAGQASFAVTPLSPLTNDSYLTATATNAAGSTSELGACFLFSDLLFTDGYESGDTSAWSETETSSP